MCRPRKIAQIIGVFFGQKAPFGSGLSGSEVPGSEVPRLVGDTHLFNKINRVGPESLKRLTLNLEPGTLNLDRIDVQ